MAGSCPLALVVAAAVFGSSAAVASAVIEPTDGTSLENVLTPHAPRQALGLPISSQPAEQAQVGNPLWAVPLRVLTATRDRPLFSPSRRPPPAAVVAAPAPIRVQPPPPGPDHPPLTLLGTVIGTNASIGIFVDQSNKRVIRLMIGQEHDGWILRAVHERDAVFKARGKESVLALPARRTGTVQHTSAALSSLSTPSGTWRDGDGQLIGAPAPAAYERATPHAVPAAATWRDGDGQLISPPVVRN